MAWNPGCYVKQKGGLANPSASTALLFLAAKATQSNSEQQTLLTSIQALTKSTLTPTTVTLVTFS